MKLFELAAEYRDMVEAAESGHDVGDAFDRLSCALEDKVVGTVRVMRELELDADKLDAEIKRLTAKKRAADNAAEHLRERLRLAMIDTGVTKIQADTFTVSVSECPARVEVVDETLVPIDFIRYKQAEPDKAKIMAEYRDNGVIVPGTAIKRGTRLVVR